MTETARAFAGIPRTPVDHFRVNLHAAAYRLINYVRRLRDAGGSSLDGVFATYPFLAGYLEAMAPFLPDGLGWDETMSWWEGEIAVWERGRGGGGGADGTLPLVALEVHGVLDFETRMALLTAGLVEEDPRFGTVFADLQRPLADRRPCLDTVAAMAPGGAGDAWWVSAALLRASLVEITNPEAPRAEWVPRVRSDLWEVLRGLPNPTLAPWCRQQKRDELSDLDVLILPEGLSQRLRQVPRLLASGRTQGLVLRGMRGSDRSTVAGAVARALDRGALFVDAARVPGEEEWRRVGPLCTALAALPVLVHDLTPGESADVPDLVGYAGPLVMILGLEGGLRGQTVASSVTVEMPPTPVEERRRHWETALGGYPLDDLAAVSELLHLPPAHIRRAAASATAMAAMEGRETVTIEDVREACRTLNRQHLDTLAVRLDAEGDWGQLVVSDLTGLKLQGLERRCRHRERVLRRLAPAFLPATNRGVRALFTGASGTGKTLAASILAAELGMDLYRVDLSAIVNKYVGETEKNLHRVLSTAEELDVVLLIDEGEALLGARTEVRSANDRFANLETNYLLQRLEVYQGIVVVTTNASDHIDPAFQRRMDAVVQFVEPGPVERWNIWQIHLPGGHRVSGTLLREVSERCVMTGGQIRNAALHATLMALDGDGTVQGSHVEQAIAAEYGKAGAVSPFDAGGGRDAGGGVQAFLEVLS
jgi:hypothetical protein